MDNQSIALRDIVGAVAGEELMLRALERHEWKMGNGQCWVCQGVGPSFYPHPLHMTPDTIGHTAKCEYAKAMREAGGAPIMVGSYKPEPIQPGTVSHLLVQNCLALNASLRRIGEETERAAFEVLSGKA